MSTETEEELAVTWPKDPAMETPKKPKRSYTIEFLLSLSELEVCKKLPNGFDKSLLSEFQDASQGFQERERAVGSSSLQGFRRTDYGSSVPVRGGFGAYSRGLQRWDSRSSGQSDTDSDSESGRRYGSLAKRSGPHSEHDGLLGSGSFPRPLGYAAGASASKFRPNSSLHPNKSNEPYQPPRPFKAVPHSRRDKDSFNDETFGSPDSASEDKVEEEKKRRAEFELIRKEQQKALQGKPKLSDPFSDITGPLEDSTDGKISSDSDKVLNQPKQNDSSKSVSLQAPPSRPVAPPGFVNSAVDRSSTAKTLMHGEPFEVGKVELENSHRDMKSTAQERDSCEMQCVTTSSSASKPRKLIDMPSALRGADQVNNSSCTSVSEFPGNDEIMWLDPGITEDKILGESGRSTSILEKIFGSALTVSSDIASNLVEDQGAKADVIWSPKSNTLQSKFASWFLEEDKKTLGDISQDKPNDLLSLIVGNAKGVSNVSDVTAMGPMLPPESMLGHITPISATASSTASISQLFSNSNTPRQKPAVLTCEYLEQSILSEIGGNSVDSLSAETYAGDEKALNPDAGVDNRASNHLLSLLQKGMGSKNVISSTSVVEEGSPEKPCGRQVEGTEVIDGSINGVNKGLEINSSGNTLTLEALFGTAFMNELHSAQRNSVGCVRTDVIEPPFPTSDGALFSSEMNDIRNGMGSRDGSIFVSNDGIPKLDSVGHLGVHDPRKELDFSKPPVEVDSKFGGLDKGIDVQLPEEDSLISPINARNSILLHDSSSSRGDLVHSSNGSLNVLEKLAALGAAIEDQRSIIGGQDPPSFHGPYEMVKPELPYQNLHPEASSPYLHAPKMNHGKPFFDHVNPNNAHIDLHMKFMPLDTPIHNQFPVNMGHPPPLPHHSARLHSFDRHIPPPILEQMHMAGNFPPPHLVGGFPGGAPMPPHSSRNPTGYLEERNPMQGFPFGQRQPNFGGPGMPPPGPEFGGAYNPPEAFQRLLEMELRTNPKPTHPFTADGHGRPMYGPELDMGFRYR